MKRLRITPQGLADDTCCQADDCGCQGKDKAISITINNSAESGPRHTESPYVSAPVTSNYKQTPAYAPSYAPAAVQRQQAAPVAVPSAPPAPRPPVPMIVSEDPTTTCREVFIPTPEWQ
jgi:hypothetical protein